MPTAQEYRDRARVLRARANDQPTAEAALAARSLAASYERKADDLDAQGKSSDFLRASTQGRFTILLGPQRLGGMKR